MSKKDNIRIVVLDKGFVSVGRFTPDKEWCKLESASVIRYWGTTRGLGEIAANGPTSNTKLDPSPTQHFPLHSVVKVIECDAAKWKDHIK